MFHAEQKQYNNYKLSKHPVYWATRFLFVAFIYFNIYN